VLLSTSLESQHLEKRASRTDWIQFGQVFHVTYEITAMREDKN